MEGEDRVSSAQPLMQNPMSSKQTMGIHIANLIIKTALGVASLYISYLTVEVVRKQIRYSPFGPRTELMPGGSGRLIAVEYEGLEIKKVRYATKKEIFTYSKALMEERLVEMGLDDPPKQKKWTLDG